MATRRATKKKSVATKKKSGTQGAPRKRSGNPNSLNQLSRRNNPKLLHGLRSKFLHLDQVEIMKTMEDISYADQLWLQIEIKFSAIIHMQKIMCVESDDDHLKEESGYTSTNTGGGTTYKVAFAYERY